MATILVLVVSGLAFMDYAQKLDRSSNLTASVKNGVTLSATTRSYSSNDEGVSTVKDFLALIDAKQVAQAVDMLTPEIIASMPARQAWEEQFTAFASVLPVEVQPAEQDRWSNTIHIYKVKVNAEINPAAANAPIPYYGYDNGLNVRWIALQKVNEVWKILSISTGP